MFGEFLLAIETSGLGHAARGQTWLYPLANLAHVLGAALLVGSIVVFDALVLSRRYSEAGTAGRAAIPVAVFGLVLLGMSGSILFSAEAAATGRNPAFLFKMVMVVIGLLNVCAYYWSRRLKVRGALGLPVTARLHALVSVCVWVSVLLAGRSIAYL